MGLFRRSKKQWHPSIPADGAANPLEEEAEAEESGRGAVGPQVAGGARPLPGTGPVDRDPLAADELRAAADPEDDEAESSLIERERRRAEHDDEPNI